MRFSYARQILGQMRYMKRLLKNYSAYLMPGRYLLLPNLRSMALDRPVTLEKMKAYFRAGKISWKLRTLLSFLNRAGYFHNRGSATSVGYEAVYSANNYDPKREVKLFSFERGQILTLCVSPEDCKKQLLLYKTLHSAFPMPPVAKQESCADAYTISMVSVLPRLSDSEALAAILKSHSAYSGRKPGIYQSVSEIIDFCYDHPQMDPMLRQLAARISPEALQLRIPLCFQHGDLSRENLLYGSCEGKESFWWIDWEHGGVRLFFYDYFFYLLNTALYYQDDSALRAYLQGAYDGQLKEYFAAFGVPYEQARRKDYFLVYALAFLRERACDRGNVAALKMYRDFILEKVLS